MLVEAEEVAAMDICQVSPRVAPFFVTLVGTLEFLEYRWHTSRVDKQCNCAVSGYIWKLEQVCSNIVNWFFFFGLYTQIVIYFMTLTSSLLLRSDNRILCMHLTTDSRLAIFFAASMNEY